MQSGKGAISRASMLVIAAIIIIILAVVLLLSGTYIFKSVGPITCTGTNCAPQLFGSNVSTDCVSVGQPLYSTTEKINVSDFVTNAMFYSCTFTYNKSTDLLTVSCPHNIGSYSGNSMNFPVVSCLSNTTSTSVGSTSVTTTTASSTTTTTGSGSSSSTSTATTTTGSSSTTTVGYTYVASDGNGYNYTVSVVDVAANSIAKTIAIGNKAWGGIAESPDGSLVYFTNYYNDTVGIINTTTNKVVKTVAVGASPDGVAFSPYGDVAYVADRASNNVSVINTSAGTVVKTIHVGSGPYGIAFSPSGSFAYVINHFGDTVSVINTSTESVVGTITVGGGTGNLRINAVAFSPSGNIAYVTQSNGNKVTEISPAANKVVGNITVGSGPDAVAFDSSGSVAYVVNYNDNTTSVINVSTAHAVSTIKVGTNPDAVAFPTSNLVYVASWAPSSAGVNVISTSTGSIVKTILIGGYVWGIATKPQQLTKSAPAGMNFECVGGSNPSVTLKSVYSTYLSSSGVGAWTPAQPYPINDSMLSCSSYNGYAYCIGGAAGNSGVATNSTYFSPLHGAWSASDPYPLPTLMTSCNAYSGYIYCVGGGTGILGAAYNSVYSAPITPSGIGNWSAQFSLPIKYQHPYCFINGIHLYCIMGNTTSSFFATVGGGGVSSWTFAPGYPLDTSAYNNRISCATSSGYVYCAGGGSSKTYYATVSGAGIGPWKSTTAYPISSAAGMQCTASNGYMYCTTGGSFGGGGNLTYYAPVSSSGIGNWSRTAYYPVQSVNGASCFTNASQTIAPGGTSSIALLRPTIKVAQGSSNSTNFTVNLATGSSGPTNLNFINGSTLRSSYGITSSAYLNSFGYPTYKGVINIAAGSSTPTGIYNLWLNATGYDPASSIKLIINVTGSSSTTTTTTTVPGYYDCNVCNKVPIAGFSCPPGCTATISCSYGGFECVSSNSTSTTTTSTTTTSTSTSTSTTSTISYDTSSGVNGAGTSISTSTNPGDSAVFCAVTDLNGVSSTSWRTYTNTGFTSIGNATGNTCSESSTGGIYYRAIGAIGSPSAFGPIYATNPLSCSSCTFLNDAWTVPNSHAYVFLLFAGNWPGAGSGYGIRAPSYCTQQFAQPTTGSANGYVVSIYACNPPTSSGMANLSIASSGEISISAVVVT